MCTWSGTAAILPVGSRDGRLPLRSRRLQPAGVDRVAGRAGLVRPRAAVELRLQPRGGRALLRARGRRRPRLRARALGHRLRRRARTTTRTGTPSTPSTCAPRCGSRTTPSPARASSPTTRPPVERDLIEALARAVPGAPSRRTTSRPGRPAYADAMAGVHARHPDDLDVAALYADAMMNLTAWQLWEVATGEPAEGARTLEIQRVLEAAIGAARAGSTHPGVLHLYVHLMEMSAHPERALGAADALRDARPRTPVTCSTCRRTSTCSAATTRAWSPATPPRSPPTTPTPRTPATSASTRSTARTTTTSGSTGRCSSPSEQVALEAAGALEAMLTEELLRDRGPADGGLARGLRADAAARARPLRPLGRADRRRRCPPTPSCTARRPR